MKKFLSIFLTVALTIAITPCAFADDSHKTEEDAPILFRDIEWGVPLPEALQGMPEGVKFYNMDADSSYSVEGTLLDEHERYFDGHVVGYVSSRSSSIEEVKIAGYELSRITMRFSFVPNEDGALVEDDSHTKLYYAEYEINPKDFDAAYADLTEKLSSLYGDQTSTKYSSYVIGEKYTVWNGSDNTMLVLFGKGYSSGRRSIEIRYGTLDGNEWLQQAYDALVKQESISAASNMDGL